MHQCHVLPEEATFSQFGYETLLGRVSADMSVDPEIVPAGFGPVFSHGVEIEPRGVGGAVGDSGRLAVISSHQLDDVRNLVRSIAGPHRRGVDEDRPHARVGMGRENRFGEGRVDLNVGPIDHGGHACLGRPEKADQRGCVRVFGGEVGAVDRRTDLLFPRSTTAEIAEQGLPGVAMAVDEAGHHDGVGAVDHFGIPRPQASCDLCDQPIFHQDVRLGVIADRAIHGEDTTSLDQDPLGHAQPLLLSTDSTTVL